MTEQNFDPSTASQPPAGAPGTPVGPGTTAPAAGQEGATDAPVSSDPQEVQEPTDAAAGAAAVGALVTYQWLDPRNDTEHTRYGVVVEIWDEPDAEGQDVQLARVIELPEAGVVALDKLTAV